MCKAGHSARPSFLINYSNIEAIRKVYVSILLLWCVGRRDRWARAVVRWGVSDAHAGHALAVATHVLLSVNCHLRQHVLFKLLVARAGPTSAVRRLHAVRSVRFLGARAAGSLSLAPCGQVIACNVALNTLHAGDLHLVV